MFRGSSSGLVPARRRAAVSVCALLGLVAAGAGADTVVLRNGNVLEGRAERRANGDVVLRSELGTLVLSSTSVERVERGATAEDEILAHLETPGLAVADLMALARRSIAEGASTLGRRILERVIDLEPDHQEARRLLGFVRYEGRWILRQDAGAASEPVARPSRDRALDLLVLRSLLTPAPAAPAPSFGPGIPIYGAGVVASPHVWPPHGLPAAPAPAAPRVDPPSAPRSVARPQPRVSGPRSHVGRFLRP